MTTGRCVRTRDEPGARPRLPVAVPVPWVARELEFIFSNHRILVGLRVQDHLGSTLGRQLAAFFAARVVRSRAARRARFHARAADRIGDSRRDLRTVIGWSPAWFVAARRARHRRQRDLVPSFPLCRRRHRMASARWRAVCPIAIALAVTGLVACWSCFSSQGRGRYEPQRPRASPLWLSSWLISLASVHRKRGVRHPAHPSVRTS